MIKNSKYIILMLGLLVAVQAFSQGRNRFNALDRDLEVTRVTFLSFLKKWDEGVLLNRFKGVEADYQKGTGLNVSVDAENAQIFMSVQNGNFKNADSEVLDTFFSDNMVALQQERLLKALKSFLQDYKDYLPELGSNERVRFIFEVKDHEWESKKEPREPSPQQHKRTYTLQADITTSDLEDYKKGALSRSIFEDRIKINLNNN